MDKYNFTLEMFRFITFYILFIQMNQQIAFALYNALMQWNC